MKDAVFSDDCVRHKKKMPYQIQFDEHHQSIIVVVLTALTNPLLAEILL